MLKILYIVNFYGTPPLNYFEKYIKENKLAELNILKLPAVRLMKKRLFIDAFIIDHKENKHEQNLNILFPFPAAIVFVTQYFINLILLFTLLRKISTKHFDICIGETSFGSACAYLLKLLKRVKTTVYMNGDVLPPKNLKENFYFSNEAKITYPILHFFDRTLIIFQYILRKFGAKCNLIWYVTDKIRQWDIKNGYKVKKYFFTQAAFIDQNDFNKYSRIKKTFFTLGYIGRLDESAGLDIIIESIPIIRKKIKQIRLEIVGGGDASVEHYKEIAKKNNALNNITFYGYLPEMDDAFNILAKTSLGIALYKPSSTNVSLYTDASKVKEYIKVGLPVIITKGGPAIAQQIKENCAGIVVEYNKYRVAEEIVRLFKNPKSYKNLEVGVKNLAKSLDYKKHIKIVWEEINKAHTKNILERPHVNN